MPLLNSRVAISQHGGRTADRLRTVVRLTRPTVTPAGPALMPTMPAFMAAVPPFMPTLPATPAVMSLMAAGVKTKAEIDGWSIGVVGVIGGRRIVGWRRIIGRPGIGLIIANATCQRRNRYKP